MMKPLTIHSNGMGQQSVALYLLSSLGFIPKFDYSIFADPGSEKNATYEYFELLQGWAKKNNGIPLVKVNERDLKQDLINGTNSTGDRFASIPAFTKSSSGKVGMIRRQCTQEYKIDVVNRYIRRQIYGLKKRQWMPKGTRMVIGITLEEMGRVRTPQNSRLIHLYPFLNISSSKQKTKFNASQDYSYCFRWTRSHCVHFIKSLDLPIPPKSSCTFCPFTNDRDWLDMKKNEPDEFQQCVDLDYSIRDSSMKGVKNPIYLHESCVPLDQVNFNENQEQIYFECEGICNI